MEIALFGATGHLGQAILEEALTRGYDVTAIVRDPARITQRNDKLKIVTGDVTQIDLRSPTHYFLLLKSGDKKDVERGKET